MGAAEKMVEMTPRLLVALLQSTKEMIEMLMKILEEFKEYSSARLLNKHLKDNQDVDFQICKGFSKEAFGKKLNEYGIPHAFFVDEKTGLTICVTRDKDREKVRDARISFFREQRLQSKVSHSDFNHLNAGTKVMCYSNLTAVQDKKIAEYAKANGIVTSSVKHDDGTYSVYFSTKDSVKANDAFRKTITDTMGVKGKITNEQYTKEINNVKKYCETFTDTKADVYIVSTANPKDVIHFTGNDFERTTGNNLVTLSKNDSNFVQDAFNHTMEMVEPMLVSKNDYDSINKLIDKYCGENNLKRNVTASTVWTFINKQYDGDVGKFLNDLDCDKTRFTINENRNGNQYLKIQSDNEKVFFTKEERNMMALENDIQHLLLENDDIMAIDVIKKLEQLEPDHELDEAQKDYIQKFVDEYYDKVDNVEPKISYVDQKALTEDYQNDEKYYEFIDQFDR